MKISWTPTARKTLSQIRSDHFTSSETASYKRTLVFKIQQAIELFGNSLPAREPKWRGNYRILVDNYKVYYAISPDGEQVQIKYLKHNRRE